MSDQHPIIAITGSSGAGTTSVSKTFSQIFARESVNTVFVEGDAFHRYDRAEMALRMAEAAERGNQHFSHFGPDANLFEELEELFRTYGAEGHGRMRRYVHDDEEAAAHEQPAGTFTPWTETEPDTDLLFF
ncbi:MAG: phosphoribulokinase, partial [Aeromicrobium sp.]